MLELLRNAKDFIIDVYKTPQVEARRKFQQERARLLDSFKLTHRHCGGTAYPIPGTTNGYRCTKCNEGFNAVKHRIPSQYL